MTWIGPHGHIVTYPLRRGELLNFVTAIERDDWLIESWSEAGTVDECRRDFALWHPDVRRSSTPSTSRTNGRCSDANRWNTGRPAA
jgi:hypothetical protein